MKPRFNWLDEALDIDVVKYVKEGRKLMKMQKFPFAFDKDSQIKLALFLDRLEIIRNNVRDLKTWRSWASPNKNDFIYDLINDAPDIMKSLLLDITYGNTG